MILNSYKNLLFLLSTGILLGVQSCIDLEKKSVVEEKCLKYLKIKYNKGFKILDFDQHINGGTWKYSTSMKVSPDDDETLVFEIFYDAGNRKVYGDNYKSTLWNSQFSKDINPIISETYRNFHITASFGEKKHSYLSCSEMKYFKEYAEILKELESPASDIYIYVDKDSKKKADELACFVNLAKFLSKKPFVINRLSIYFCNEQFFKRKRKKNKHFDTSLDSIICYKQLAFKFTEKDSLPSGTDLQELETGYQKDNILFEKNEVMFNKAQNEQDKQKAIETYFQIMQNVSKYRSNLYMPFQSCWAVESACNAAELLEQEKKHADAKKLYRYIIDYFEYEEHPRQLHEYYDIAKKKLELEE